MTPQLAALFLSVIGALLFFSGGVFFATLRTDRKNAHEIAEDDAVKTISPLLDEKMDTLKKSAEKAAREREQAVGEKQKLKKDFDRLKRKADAYFSEAKTRFSQVKDELAAEKKLTAELKSRESQKEKPLSRELEEFEKDRAQLSETLEMTRLELAEKNEKISNLKIEIAQLKEENSTLKFQNETLAPFKDEVAELKRENNRLRASGIVLDDPPGHGISATADGLGGAFQFVAAELSKMEGARGAVLADELGLVVAGTGDHMEAMAGVAAIFSGLGMKLERMLPFGRIDKLTITNPQGLTITLQPFAVDSDTLVVATLTVGEGPNRSVIDALMAKAGRES